METLELKKFKILYVDDEKDNLDVFRFNFRKIFNISTVTSGDEGLQKLAEEKFSVIITDQRMLKMSGLQFLAKAKRIVPHAIGIILTAYRDVDVLIEAINLGYVYRFITKPWNSEELKAAITQAIELYHLKDENRRLENRLQEYTGYLDQEAHEAFNFGNIIGESESLKTVLTNIERVAPTNSTVLIRGETGTGKELIAHAIHLNSGRCNAPFVKVNCAALAKGVLESELFGHEKGAFTGAFSKRLGRFELAHTGTIFLDEVGDLPFDIQIQLLRVLQEREFERVGGQDTVKVDVRVISATHRDLEQLVRDGLFRHDLYYRLNVFPIKNPSLKDRVEDIKPLVKHFVEKYSVNTGKQIDLIEDEFFSVLEKYNWPGNVRELENLIERALILSNDRVLKSTDLDFGPVISEIDQKIQPKTRKPLETVLVNEEKKSIIEAFEESKGNVAAASRLLGINRSTLYYRLKKHNLTHILPGNWSKLPKDIY
jgi:two-component system, NtrC family, response regulator AtoC